MEIEKQLLAITQEFISELESERAHRVVSLDSSFLKDLGIDSLEKVELFHSIEAAFDIEFSDEVIGEAEYLKDLIAPIQTAKPRWELTKGTREITLEKADYDPSSAESLVEVLDRYFETDAERPHIYLRDEQGNEQTIRYGQLLKVASEVAAGLQNIGLRKNDTVAIMLPTSSSFFYSFFGILLAGCIPVPIYPPFRPDRIEEYVMREALILRNAGARVLITFHRAETLSKLLRPLIPSLSEVATIESLRHKSRRLQRVEIHGSDAALIQYTSGSTSDPKGVLLSHYNLLSNIRGIGKALQITPSDTSVSWLPLYHDMGLIGAWLSHFYHGNPITIFSPLSFITRPERWLWAIHHHRATISGAPNFAFELCIKRIEEKNIDGLDLSSLRILSNGAEEIKPDTLSWFTEKFAPYGFREEAFFPVYGLAESAVGLTFPPIGRKPKIDKVKMKEFHERSLAIPASESEKHVLRFVSCGKAMEGHEIIVVDNEGNELPERQVGKLKFRGPSASEGYFNNPEGTKRSFIDGWWDACDLAYIADGEVYIAGREKDVIIKAGRNLYPQEIEDVTSQVEGVRRGCVIAFAAKDKKWGTENIVIIAETREKQAKKKKRIIEQISEVVSTAIDVPPDEIILVPPGTVPKTSSGKLKRSACQQAYLQKKLAHTSLPIAIQLAKITIRSALNTLSHWISILLRGIYTLYVFLLVFMTGFILWCLLFLLPRDICTRLAKFWARILFLFGGCPVEIYGQENMNTKVPTIYLANHKSYADAVLLSIVLPVKSIFIGRADLLETPFIANYLRQLRFIPVDSEDLEHSDKVMNTMKELIAEGYSIVIFPEGQFGYPSELRPFKLGAFILSVETNLSICPIRISGTNTLWPAHEKLLRPCKLSLTIGELLEPKENTHEEINRLRTETRAHLKK